LLHPPLHQSGGNFPTPGCPCRGHAQRVIALPGNLATLRRHHASQIRVRGSFSERSFLAARTASGGKTRCSGQSFSKGPDCSGTDSYLAPPSPQEISPGGWLSPSHNQPAGLRAPPGKGRHRTFSPRHGSAPGHLDSGWKAFPASGAGFPWRPPIQVPAASNRRASGQNRGAPLPAANYLGLRGREMGHSPFPVAGFGRGTGAGFLIEGLPSVYFDKGSRIQGFPSPARASMTWVPVTFGNQPAQLF